MAMAAVEEEAGSAGLRIIMLLRAAWEVPPWEYATLVSFVLAFFLYYALEFHFLEDLCSGFRGHPVELIYNHASSLASQILPGCRILKKRYWPTPWLCSTHLQTAFLHFFGQPPQFNYHRQLYRTPDGGTIALDWLDPLTGVKRNDDEAETISSMRDGDEIPIVVVIPGLTSDSADAYVKHIVYKLATSGWRVVVSNHRGLGGVSITSNQLYNAGWTEDLRRIILHLHKTYPKAQLLAVGTSIGANILVKYLGEEGKNTPLGGAAAICCPWDLLVCDRFISRRMIQRVYDKILAFGLRSYAELHQAAVSQIADWELISKSRSVRDFDNHCTRVVSQYETVDTYYRKCSSAYYLHSVSIPLFCVSSLDDPVCTKEAIPWDECRTNTNVLLALTRHGGHLAFFEGLTAGSIWWVRATTEFLRNLSSSTLLHVPKQVTITSSGLTLLPENVMDKFPYVSLFQNGVAAAEEVTPGYLRTPEEVPEEVIQECSKEERFKFDTNESVQAALDISELQKNPDGLYEEDAMAEKKTTKMVRNTDSQDSSSEIHVEHSRPLTLNLSLQNDSELIRFESALSQVLLQLRIQRENLQNGNKVLEARASCIQACKVAIPNPETAALEDPNQENMGILETQKDHGTSNKSGAPALKDRKVLTRKNKQSLRMLAYFAVISLWPILGSILFMYGRKRLGDLVRRYWGR